MEQIGAREGNPYRGIYWSFDPPAQWYTSGEYLSIEDFQNTCLVTEQDRGQGTYAFNYLLISMAVAENPDDIYAHKLALDLKDPFRKNKEYFVATQAALDFYHEYLDGRVGLVGFGPKTLKILELTLYDEELEGPQGEEK